MKVSKWVDFGQEVEVEIGIEDVRSAMAEAFEGVTRDRLGDHDLNISEIMRAYNLVAMFLKAVSDLQITLMNAKQRAVIGAFLAEQAARFKESV